MSTVDQTEVSQLDALHASGVDRVWTDRGVSGAKRDRPELDVMLSHLRDGDSLVVWRLDRLARSTRHLLELADDLAARGVHLVSLTESIDTATAGGRLTFTILAAVAEMERSLIRERTLAGLAAARLRGRVGGRPRVLSDRQVDAARRLRESGESVRAIAAAFNTSSSTVQRAVTRPKMAF